MHANEDISFSFLIKTHSVQTCELKNLLDATHNHRVKVKHEMPKMCNKMQKGRFNVLQVTLLCLFSSICNIQVILF